jgi:hypothetical protein
VVFIASFILPGFLVGLFFMLVGVLNVVRPMVLGAMFLAYERDMYGDRVKALSPDEMRQKVKRLSWNLRIIGVWEFILGTVTLLIAFYGTPV